MLNLPQPGYFCIAEVNGNYSFQILPLEKTNDINNLGEDYGHVLPVRLLTPSGINKSAKSVDAGLRSTMKTPSRMWNIDYYMESIQKLLLSLEEGEDVVTAVSSEERLENVWQVSLQHAKQILHDRLADELNKSFQVAEWEEPIVSVLRNLYPDPAQVEWKGGPYEYGADWKNGVIH